MATIARAAPLLLGDQVDHHRAVGGVERGGRLVEQQDRQVRQKAARDVDALLLAAGEGRRRQAPQRARGMLSRAQQLGRALARAASRRGAVATSGSATMSIAGTRGTARRNWLT